MVETSFLDVEYTASGLNAEQEMLLRTHAITAEWTDTLSP